MNSELEELSLPRRLRQFQADEPGFPPLFTAAASKIEKLQAERDRAINLGQKSYEEALTLSEEVERLRALSAWQPIETAPKDGTPIEVCNTRHPAHAPVIVRWDNDGISEDLPDPHWCDAATRDGSALYYNENYFDFWKPTTPLPAPPVEAKSEVGG